MYLLVAEKVTVRKRGTAFRRNNEIRHIPDELTGVKQVRSDYQYVSEEELAPLL
jgi:hypothetical protein